MNRSDGCEDGGGGGEVRAGGVRGGGECEGGGG